MSENPGVYTAMKSAVMKTDLKITLFNSQKAGNYDSENLVFHIFSTQEHVQRLPKKDK